MLSYDRTNLSKHRVLVTEVDEVLADGRTIWLDLGISRSGNDRLMFIGLTRAGRALEIGIELLGEHEHVFHAMDAGAAYLKEFNNAQKGNS